MSNEPRRPTDPTLLDEYAEEERQRIRLLLRSRAYVRADRDSQLLERDELRHARLQLEYLKPEIALREHGVESVIVLFGGTRVIERSQAEARAAAIRAALADAPGDVRALQDLAVAERIVAKSHYYDVARDFARLVSNYCARHAPCEFFIATGGGPGIMEAGNRGAYEGGRPTIGLNIVLPHEQYPNPYITPELCFQFRYFALRKLHFLKRAKALVAFPGGYGTFDEVFDALCLVQTHKMAAIPIVLVGESFWRRAFDAAYLAAEGVIAEEDLGLFRYAETAEEIWTHVRAWYGLPERPDCGEEEQP